MPPLPRNVRVGRHGRIGILKKVPRDLWEHPRYKGKAKVIERSTGVADAAGGMEIARVLLADLEREFAKCRAELKRQQGSKRPAAKPPAGEAADLDRPRSLVATLVRQYGSATLRFHATR